MLIKVSEATPRQLDYMVAYIMGATEEWHTDKPFLWNGVPCVREAGHDVEYTPSIDWSQGGPIIEREFIDVVYCPGDAAWRASMDMREKAHEQYGPTPLIAAMRCYVVAKWNHEVEIPEELTA